MNTLPALVQFLQPACFSPVIDTWCKAIGSGFFATFTGLISILMIKHLPKFIKKAKGRLILALQHVRSTRNQPQPRPKPPPQPIHQPIIMAGVLHTENPTR